MLSVFLHDVHAQTRKRKYHSKRDSLRAAILSRDSLMRTFKKSDTSINGLLKKVEDYNSTYNDIKTQFIAGHIDTADISLQIPKNPKKA